MVKSWKKTLSQWYCVVVCYGTCFNNSSLIFVMNESKYGRILKVNIFASILPFLHTFCQIQLISSGIYIYIYILWTRCVWKVTSPVSQTILIPNNRQHSFSFKIILVKFNALCHDSPPHSNALLEGFFWDAPQFYHYGSLDGLHIFKMGPLYSLELGGEKVTWSKIRWIVRLFQYNGVLLWQELSDALSWWSNHDLSCYNSHLFLHTILLVDLPINLLVLWQ